MNGGVLPALHMPGFLEQTRHAVLEVHRRDIRQAEPGQHSDQRTQSELPHAQFEIFTGFEMNNTPGAYLSRVGVHVMLRQMNVFLVQSNTTHGAPALISSSRTTLDR